MFFIHAAKNGCVRRERHTAYTAERQKSPVAFICDIVLQKLMSIDGAAST
jgi:hypothetical protein